MARSQPAPREVTVDEAIRIAVGHQQAGRLPEAADIYARILQRRPDHAAALHYTGILKHQRGDTEAGIGLLERSILLEPHNGDAHTDLGNLLAACRHLARAAAAYRAAIALNPRDAIAFSNLGVVLRQQGKPAEAEAAHRKALELVPESANAHRNFGALLMAENRHAEAIECFDRVIALAPNDNEARRCLAVAYGKTGQRDAELDLYARWLRDEPDNAYARHMLAACSGRDAPARAADAFIEQLFDDFAPTFDEHLQALNYQAPALIAARLADRGVTATRTLDILDAGCGTGLCGALLAPYARRLVGVDLSARMLAGAQRQGVYDELVKAEITRFIEGCPAGSYDVIVSADCLVYFGALDAFIAGAARALKHAGQLLFTVERSGPNAAGTDYTLESHGRYSHDEGYVRRTLAAAGFTVTVVAAELRMESARPVAGLLVAGELVRPSAHTSTAANEPAGEPHG